MLKARCLGDNMVFISYTENSAFTKILEENKDWFETIFEYIKPWSEQEMPYHRLTWVRCWGLPLSLWNEECLSKIVSSEGKLISLQKVSLSRNNIEFVRVLVRTTNGHTIDVKRDFKINGVVYHVCVKEEQPWSSGDCLCSTENLSQSDSVSSIEPEGSSSSILERMEPRECEDGIAVKLGDASVVSPENDESEDGGSSGKTALSGTAPAVCPKMAKILNSERHSNSNGRVNMKGEKILGETHARVSDQLDFNSSIKRRGCEGRVETAVSKTQPGPINVGPFSHSCGKGCESEGNPNPCRRNNIIPHTSISTYHVVDDIFSHQAADDVYSYQAADNNTTRSVSPPATTERDLTLSSTEKEGQGLSPSLLIKSDKEL